MLTLAAVRENPQLYIDSHDDAWKNEHAAAAFLCLQYAPASYAAADVIPTTLKESDEYGLNIALQACKLDLNNVKAIKNGILLKKLIRHNMQHPDPSVPFFHYVRSMQLFPVLEKKNWNMQQLHIALLRECVPLFQAININVLKTRQPSGALAWEICFSHQHYMRLCYLDCMICASQVVLDGIDAYETEQMLMSTDPHAMGVLMLLIKKTDWIRQFIGSEANPLPIIKMVHYCFHCCVRYRKQSELYRTLLEQLRQLCAGCANLEDLFFQQYQRPHAALSVTDPLMSRLFDFKSIPSLDADAIRDFRFKHWHEPGPYYGLRTSDPNPLGFELSSPGGDDHLMKH